MRVNVCCDSLEVDFFRAVTRLKGFERVSSDGRRLRVDLLT